LEKNDHRRAQILSTRFINHTNNNRQYTMVEQQTVNDDLRKERTTCTFNTEELTNFIDGGAEYTDKRRQIGIYIINYYT
jgi:hypothetical protein